MKVDYIKISSITDKLILLEKVNRNIFNSSNPWSLWTSFLIVFFCSIIFSASVNLCNLNYNIFVLNAGSEANINILNIGKILIFNLSFWFLLTITATRINQKEHGSSELLYNIGHMLALVSVVTLPISLLGLLLNLIINGSAWIFINLIYLIFLLGNVGTFFFACSEKTKKAPELDFVYIAKKVDPKQVQVFIVFILLFIIGGIYYASVLSPISTLINENILFRPTIIILSLFLILVLPVFIGGLLRSKFDSNSYLISFYGYSKSVCVLFIGLFLVDIFFTKINTQGDVLNNIYYIISLYFVIILSFLSFIYQTNLIFSPNGYGYDTVIIKKKINFISFFKKPLKEESNSENLPQPEVVSEEVKNNTHPPKQSILSKDVKDVIKIPKITPETIKNILNKEIDTSFFRFILDVINFDLLFKKDDKAIYFRFAYFFIIFVNIISGILFYFYDFSFLKYIVNTKVWYIDIFIGILWSIIFLLGTSFVFYIVLKLFKIKSYLLKIFTNINYSLIPFSILVCISLFFNEKIRTIILDYSLYVALFWAIAYFILYYILNFKIEKKKIFLVWTVNILLIFTLFFGLSYTAYFTNIELYSFLKAPIARVRLDIVKQIPKENQYIADNSLSNLEPVDLTSTSISDFLSHVEYMKKYKNDEEFIYPIRIANEVSMNQNWASYIYKKQPKDIKNAIKLEDKVKKIFDFVNTNIKEEKTTYPFGDTFWQDSVTTFKRKYGKKTDIAVLMVAMLRTNGIPAKINKEITPDKFFNNSYNLVEYYDGNNWKPLYPKQKEVKSNQEDINKLKAWVDNGPKDNLAFYYIKNNELFAYGSGERFMVAKYSYDLLPGEYMASYKKDNCVKLSFFEIRETK